MSTVLVATIAGLITAFCWGIGDWMQARNSKKIGPVETFFAVSLNSLIIIAPLLLVSNLQMPTTDQWVTLIEGSTLIAIAYLTFLRALASGAVGIVVPLGNVYPLITLAMLIIFLDQVFGVVQVTAMVGIVAGAALLAYEKNHQKIPIKELHYDTGLALFAAFVWGVAFFVLNPLFGEISWQLIFLSNGVIMTLLAGMLLLKSYKAKAPPLAWRLLINKSLLATGLILNGGALAFYYGADYAGDVIIVAVLAASAPLVASVMSAILDKEKLGVLKRVGAVVVVAGIIILNLA